MVTVLIGLEIYEEHANNFAALTIENCKNRADADGALHVQLLSDVSSASRFWLLESFASQTQIDNYYSTDDYASWKHAVTPMVRSWNGSDQEILYSSGSLLAAKDD